MPRSAVAELMKDPVAVGLLHFRVNVVAGVAEFSDFLRKQLDAIDRVAKDDTLIDFQFGKERVEAVDLLPLLDICIKLCDPSKREFIHEVDTVWIRDELFAEGFDSDRKGCAEQADLMVLVAQGDDLFQDWLKLGREKLISLVHDNRFHIAQIRNIF
jgi:hypothetical protein